MHRINAFGIDNVIHPSNKAVVLVESLAEESIDPERALAGTGLSPDNLADPSTRMSTRQLLALCRNAMKHVDDPLFAMRAGSRVHASHFGIFGFALLSSGTYREALDFVRNYRCLSVPLVERHFHQEEDTGNGVLSYYDYLDLDETLFRFVLEFQIGCTRTLVRDIFGDSFHYVDLQLTYPDDGHAREREELLGAPLRHGCQSNRLAFEGRWLDCPLPYRHRNTATTLYQMCEQMIKSMLPVGSLAVQVRDMLLEQPGCFPGIEEIAARLHLTSRTLRRKLQAEGTCYGEILASVRRDLAIRYLQTTRMKMEAIAESLGFSDVANFRHAFRKWTNRNPGEYRSRGSMLGIVE